MVKQDKQDKQEDYKHKLELYQAMAELDSKEKKIKSSQGYVKSYIWSILMPPIGIYYFVKYVFFTSEEGKNIKVGIISLVLATVSFFLSFWLMAIFLKQLTFSISPNSNQILKDLMVPDNQKELLQLFK